MLIDATIARAALVLLALSKSAFGEENQRDAIAGYKEALKNIAQRYESKLAEAARRLDLLKNETESRILKKAAPILGWPANVVGEGEASENTYACHLKFAEKMGKYLKQDVEMCTPLQLYKDVENAMEDFRSGMDAAKNHVVVNCEEDGGDDVAGCLRGSLENLESYLRTDLFYQKDLMERFLKKCEESVASAAFYQRIFLEGEYLYCTHGQIPEGEYHFFSELF